MVLKWFAGCVFMFMLLEGALNAMTNVTTATNMSFARWSQPAGPASITTQGGNISWINITNAAQLTAKWADLFGSIANSSIILQMLP